MSNQPQRFLGRTARRPDPRRLQLAAYVDFELLPYPAQRRWDQPVKKWGVQGNDRYGNCVICCASHLIQNWAANASNRLEPISDAAVIELSRTMHALNGYNILDRLNWWRAKEMWANRLWAYAEVNMTQPPMLKPAINTFGAIDIGLNLPSAWQSAEIWDIGSGRSYEPGSWGGHSVPCVGYDEQYAYCVTWGAVQQITWAGLATYSDEGYTLIDPEWLAKHGITPSSFNLPQLCKDLYAATGIHARPLPTTLTA